MAQSNIAPNGVQKIVKRQWTNEEYQAWFEALPTKSTPTNRPADIYELIHTGALNYTISGNDVEFDADGIEDQTILEAKFVATPERSPYIRDSKFPELLRVLTDEQIRDELERMGKILRDDNNPLTLVRIITNNHRAIPYFVELMREYVVPGEVVIETIADIET